MESGRVELLLREAIRSAKSGNNSWARDCLTRIIRTDPNHEQAWLWLSAVLETPAEKRYCLERVLQINSQNTQAQAGLKWLDKQEGLETEEDTGPTRTICPMCGEPNDPRAFRCVNCDQDLFVQCPNCGERVDIDMTACSVCKLEIGVATDPPSYFFHLGELYLEHNKPREALEAWDKTLLLKPDYPEIAEVAAEAFLASNQRDLALQSFQRAIEEAKDEPHRRRLRMRLANVYRDLGNFEEAAKIYKVLLQEDKERREPQADLYTEMGRFYQAHNDIEEARYYFDLALALDENLHDVRFTQVEFMLEEGYELRALGELHRLAEVEGELGERAKALIEELRPPVPDSFRNRWQETVRGIGRFFMIGLLMLALSLGREWNYFNVLDVVALLAFLFAGYFLMAAFVTPDNLPTFANMAELAETPLAMRLRRRRKSGEGGSNWFRRFLVWQSTSARQLTARLKVWQARSASWIQRTVETIGRRWKQLMQSRSVLAIKALPQSRFFQAVAALLRKPFFQAIGRGFKAVGAFFARVFGPLFRRLFPHRGGPPLSQQLKEGLRKGFRRLYERITSVEVTEMQIYRGMAALLGLFLLLLGGGLLLLY